jgi:uncharacterized repeat protein (TIGR02543 family)
MKDRGVNIAATNNSWGGGPEEFSLALLDAIEAQRQRGILFIAAAGNSSSDNDMTPNYPANYDLPNVITVAATTTWNDLTWFSQYGRQTVHLCAPGEDIYSTTVGNTYANSSGTSMAAPHVTGVAALLKAHHPALDWRGIKNRILAGADVMAEDGDTTITGRRLSAHGALTCANSVVLSRLKPVAESINVHVGGPIDVAALHINCAHPNGNVTVTVQPGNQSVTLLDNGLGADQVAGDGIYAGQWTPSAAGSYTLAFPGGDAVVAHVLLPYTASPTALNYRSITGTNLELFDFSFATITPPFPIRFGGGSFTALHVGSDGNINFTSPSIPWGNQPLPHAEFVTLVAPFWDDLYPDFLSAQNVFWAVRGAAPNRELVIEWRDVLGGINWTDWDCDPTGTLRFQVVFFEGKSDILFNYADVTFGAGCPSTNGGASATVGIQVAADAGTPFSFNTPSLRDNMALLWTVMSPQQSLTVTRVGTGSGTVTSAPAGITCGADCTQSYSTDTVVTLTATPATGSTFAGWSGACTGTGASCTVTMTAPKTVHATFTLTPPSRTLTVTKNGTGQGTVTSSPTGITCGSDCTEAFAHGTAVTLTATAAVGSTFTGWSAACPNGRLTMDANKTCTATFALASPSDLTIAALTAPAVGGAGLPLTVTDTTQNALGGAAPATTTAFYLSTNATVGPEDVLLGSRVVPALASGGGNLGSTTVTIPAGTTTGKYFLIARADAGAVVAEVKETNNIRTKVIYIGSDLVIKTLSAPTSARAGATLTLQVTTQNAGGGPSGASTTRVYLSANAVLDAGDTLLASRAVPALARNTSNAASIAVTIPPGTPAGTRFFIAIADAGQAVMETKETNNAKSKAITIAP